RNYWDRSDPVGYGLQVLFNAPTSDATRLFSVTRDAAFTRYPLPGKAHIDYWRDDQIHADILHEIVKGGPNQSKVVDKAWWPLQVPIDYLSYVFGRVITLAAFVYFLNRMLSPLHSVLPITWTCAIPGFPCGNHPDWWVPFWALTLPIAFNGVLEM